MWCVCVSCTCINAHITCIMNNNRCVCYLWLTPVELEVLYDEREALNLLDLTLVLVQVGQRALTKQSQPLLSMKKKHC